MKRGAVLGIVGAVLGVVTACGDGAPSGWLQEARIAVPGVGVIQEECRAHICQHNENTDLVNFDGAVYLVHRTAQGQVLGPNSSLWIYKSTDGGATFANLAILPAPVDRDLRDPHFYVVGNVLWLKALTRLPVVSTRDSNVDTISVVTHSEDGGVTWAPFAPVAPATWSFWRIKAHAGVYYTAAYEDGDLSVVLYTSTDGATWTRGADVYTVSSDTPLETELEFMPSGRLLALVRVDGTDDEILGDGRRRTEVCWAEAPYTTFTCPQEILGQRLDGPLSFLWRGRLFVVARKHLDDGNRKRTALFELTGNLEGGPLAVREWGELPSAGDTAYAGVATLDDERVLVSWYSGDISIDSPWARAIFEASDIWLATIDLTKLTD